MSIFQRLEIVIDWMEANPKLMREIGEKFSQNAPTAMLSWSPEA